MRAAVIVFSCLMAGCSSLPDDPFYWTMQGSKAVDGCTTLGVADDPTLKEANPILGESPSDGQVVAFTAGAMVLQHMLYKWAEKRGQEKVVSGILTAVNVGVVANNYHVGARCP